MRVIDIDKIPFRCIVDRDCKAGRDKCRECPNYVCDFKTIQNQPTIETKHGHWMLLSECANAGVYCSVCYKKVYKTDYANQKIKSRYCPNCGSVMNEDFEVV